MMIILNKILTQNKQHYLYSSSRVIFPFPGSSKEKVSVCWCFFVHSAFLILKRIIDTEHETQNTNVRLPDRFDIPCELCCLNPTIDLHRSQSQSVYCSRCHPLLQLLHPSSFSSGYDDWPLAGLHPQG